MQFRCIFLCTDKEYHELTTSEIVKKSFNLLTLLYATLYTDISRCMSSSRR